MELYFGGINTECLNCKERHNIYSYITKNLRLARTSCRKKKGGRLKRAGNSNFNIFEPHFLHYEMTSVNSSFNKIYS